MEIKTGLSVVSLRIVPEVVVIAARTLPVVFPVEDYSARRKSALAGPQYSIAFKVASDHRNSIYEGCEDIIPRRYMY